MAISVEQDNLAVVEARLALLQELDESPVSPSVLAVRQLGIAYIGPRPSRYTHTEPYSTDTHNLVPTQKFLRKTTSEISRIKVDDAVFDIQLKTTSDHSRRSFMPGLIMLGKLSFQAEPWGNPLERLHVWTPDARVSLDVHEGSEMQTRKMAELLLSLPEDPIRLSFPV